MKRRNKNVGKEIFIFIALLIIIMLILAVTLYDFIPSAINVQEPISYSSDTETTSIKQEIAYTNSGDADADQSANDIEKSDDSMQQAVAALKSYSINSADLSVYGQKKLYNSGNSNPFDYAPEDTINNAEGENAGGATTTAQNVELTAGKYTVGIDNEIKPGKYNVIAKEGTGNFFVKGENYDDYVGETMGVETDEHYLKEYKNLNLKQGFTIEIKGTLKVLLDCGNAAAGTVTASSSNSTAGTTSGGNSGNSSSNGTNTPTSGTSTGTFFERANSK